MVSIRRLLNLREELSPKVQRDMPFIEELSPKGHAIYQKTLAQSSLGQHGAERFHDSGSRWNDNL